MAFVGCGVGIGKDAAGRAGSSTCRRRTVVKAQGELSTKLAQALAAQWSNEDQAFENPPFWAHIRVFFRPLPPGLVNGVGFLYESYYHIDLENPYLCTIIGLSDKGDGTVESRPHKISDNTAVIGGTRKIERIQNLTADMLTPVDEDCASFFTYNPDTNTWKGAMCPGKKCKTNFKDKTAYLDGQYTVQPNKFISWDTGKDFDTDDILWGSVAGPFDFNKVESYHLNVPEYTTK